LHSDCSDFSSSFNILESEFFGRLSNNLTQTIFAQIGQISTQIGQILHNSLRFFEKIRK